MRPAMTPLGDLLSDFNTLATVTRTFESAGGIGPWLQTRLAEFRKLPAYSTRLAAQSRAVRQALGAGVSTNRLDAADNDLARIQREYPGVNAGVTKLVSLLIPYMPQINAGHYDANMLTAFASNGVDVLTTVYQVNDLLAACDDAQKQIEQSVTEANVPDDVRQRALAALSSAGVPSWLPMAALAGVALWVVRGVFKR